MTDAELCFGELTTIAARLQHRELSPVEVTRAVLARIDALDGTLHSYLTLLPEAALAAAGRAEAEIAAGRYRGPLHGIPIGIKDLCATKGVRTTCASNILRDWIPDHDATVVRRLQDAGAIVLGKLNMTEFALAGYAPGHPIPCNPWNLGHHAGGSSSGSAVAVAAGLCCGAIGTDTGGSIRVPSAWNGVVGLKPTYGRVSRAGVFPLGMTLDHIGPITRSVADAAVLFEAMAGFDPADPTSLRDPVPDCTSALARDLRGVRIGCDDAFNRGGARPGLVTAVQEVMQVLARHGAEIVAVELPPVAEVLETWAPICAAEAAVAHAATYPARAAEYGTMFRTFLELGARLRAQDYAAAHVRRMDFAGALQAIFDTADVLICPGAFMEAPPAALLDPEARFTRDLAPFLRYSAPFNFSGNPTLSLPCGFSPAGLPYGVQLVGRHRQEALLLQIGHAYQQVTDWHRRHPSLEVTAT